MLVVLVLAASWLLFSIRMAFEILKHRARRG